VADPSKFVGENQKAVRPDDAIDEQGRTWRDEVILLNRSGRCVVDMRLRKAEELYERPIYRRLVAEFDVENVYVLSAGWGLIRSDYYLPKYDITFSPVKRGYRYKRRSVKERIWQDFNQLCPSNEPLICFVSNSYVPKLIEFTKGYVGPKLAFYTSESAKVALGKAGIIRKADIRKETRDYRNWQYKAAMEWCSKSKLIELMNSIHSSEAKSF